MKRAGLHRVSRLVQSKTGTVRRSYWVSAGKPKTSTARLRQSNEKKGARLGTIFGAALGAAAGGAVGTVGGAVFGAHTAHKGISAAFRTHNAWHNPINTPGFARANAGKIAGMYGTVAVRGAAVFGTAGAVTGAAAGAAIGRGVGRVIGRHLR